MFAKLSVLILFAVAVGAVLVGLRQQRLELSHDMALMHRQIDESRQSLWVLQTQASQYLDPSVLSARLQESRLALEPITPTQGRADLPIMLVSHRQEGDGLDN